MGTNKILLDCAICYKTCLTLDDGKFVRIDEKHLGDMFNKPSFLCHECADGHVDAFEGEIRKGLEKNKPDQFKDDPTLFKICPCCSRQMEDPNYCEYCAYGTGAFENEFIY